MTRSITRGMLALLLAAAPWLARAEPVSAADTKDVRAVVEAQLKAFAADDAKQAFSYAAPSIRQMFQSPELFMEMVKNGYPVVYRPQAVVFLHPEWIEGTLVQGVQMTDASGGLWLAVYTFERGKDKVWRISGCQVQPQTGRMT